jgi:hypothetical protein
MQFAGVVEDLPGVQQLQKRSEHIRDDILAGPGHAVLGDIWRHELHRMLAAMAREWEWNSVRRTDGEAKLPSLDDYLDNADNTGFCFVFTSYWSSAGDVTNLSDADEVLSAARCVQQIVRLLNDLGSQRRDALLDFTLRESGRDVLRTVPVVAFHADHHRS